MGTSFLKSSVMALAASVLVLAPMGENQAAAQVSRAVPILKRWARSHAGELAQDGAERSASRIDRLLARHGDQIAPLLQELGPQGVRLLDELPADAAPLFRKYGQRAVLVFDEHGTDALRLARAHGDAAIDVLARHPGAGPRLLETLGGPAAPSLTRLSSESAIRLEKLVDPYTQLPPQARRVFLDQLARGGDDFVTWVWRRKAEIFGSASLAIGTLTLYKVGDGAAAVVPELIPRPAAPPDPGTQPLAAWFDRWGLPALFLLSSSALAMLILGPLVRSGTQATRKARRSKWL